MAFAKVLRKMEADLQDVKRQIDVKNREITEKRQLLWKKRERLLTLRQEVDVYRKIHEQHELSSQFLQQDIEGRQEDIVKSEERILNLQKENEQLRVEALVRKKAMESENKIMLEHLEEKLGKYKALPKVQELTKLEKERSRLRSLLKMLKLKEAQAQKPTVEDDPVEEEPAHENMEAPNNEDEVKQPEAPAEPPQRIITEVAEEEVNVGDFEDKNGSVSGSQHRTSSKEHVSGSEKLQRSSQTKSPMPTSSKFAVPNEPMAKKPAIVPATNHHQAQHVAQRRTIVETSKRMDSSSSQFTQSQRFAKDARMEPKPMLRAPASGSNANAAWPPMPYQPMDKPKRVHEKRISFAPTVPSASSGSNSPFAMMGFGGGLSQNSAGKFDTGFQQLEGFDFGGGEAENENDGGGFGFAGFEAGFESEEGGTRRESPGGFSFNF